MKIENIKCNKCGVENNYYTEVKANNNVCYCGKCNSYIKNIPYAEPKFYVGKYKGKFISEIEDINYLKWALGAMKLSESLRKAIENRISQFEYLAK